MRARFASDPLARAAPNRALKRGYDQDVAENERQFFFLPFMHSEDPVDQQRCVELYRAVGDDDGPEIRARARRHHPPLRPLSAPQSHARPRNHARGADLPRRRRLQGLGGPGSLR